MLIEKYEEVNVKIIPKRDYSNEQSTPEMLKLMVTSAYPNILSAINRRKFCIVLDVDKISKVPNQVMLKSILKLELSFVVIVSRPLVQASAAIPMLKSDELCVNL